MKSSKSSSFIALNKERGDRYVISISFDAVGRMLAWPWVMLGRLITWPFRALGSGLGRSITWLAQWDFPSSRVSFAVASFGLALGISLSLMSEVLMRPMPTMAVPISESIEHDGPRITNLNLPNVEVTFPVTLSETTEGYFQLPRDSVTHFQFSGRPQESKPIFMGVGYYSNAHDLLNQINLGDEIVVVGENDGLYRYRVVATQLRTADQLVASEQLDAQLIIAVPQDLFNREFVVVLAN